MIGYFAAGYLGSYSLGGWAWPYPCPLLPQKSSLLGVHQGRQFGRAKTNCLPKILVG